MKHLLLALWIKRLIHLCLPVTRGKKCGFWIHILCIIYVWFREIVQKFLCILFPFIFSKLISEHYLLEKFCAQREFIQVTKTPKRQTNCLVLHMSHNWNKVDDQKSSKLVWIGEDHLIYPYRPQLVLKLYHPGISDCTSHPSAEKQGRTRHFSCDKWACCISCTIYDLRAKCDDLLSRFWYPSDSVEFTPVQLAS